MEKEKLLNAIALTIIKGVGARLAKQLLDHFGTAQAILATPPHVLQKVDGIGPGLAKTIHDGNKLLPKSEKIYEQNTKADIMMLPYESTQYPDRLKKLDTPPPLLYSTKKTMLNSPHTISIVGSRNASVYGKQWVQKFISEIKPYNVTIVSGLAYGIDECAHSTAIKEYIPTVAVMPGGLDIIYPTEHTALAHKIRKNGGLITEYGMGTSIERHHFPARNGIMVGISDAVIIVEAGKKSGALITAQYANSMKREAFALPGNVDRDYSVGCNTLIKNHQAHMLTDVEDFINVMNWEKGNVKKQKTKIVDIRTLSKSEQKVISILEKHENPIAMTFLSGVAEMSHYSMSALSLKLASRNILEVLPGNKCRLVA